MWGSFDLQVVNSSFDCITVIVVHWQKIKIAGVASFSRPQVSTAAVVGTYFSYSCFLY